METGNVADRGERERAVSDSLCVNLRARMGVFVCADTTSSRFEWKAKTCHTWQGWNERKWLAVFWCHGLWAVLIRNSHTLLIHFNSLLSTALPIPSVVYSSLCPLAFLSVCVWFHVCGSFSACSLQWCFKHKLSFSVRSLLLKYHFLRLPKSGSQCSHCTCFCLCS